MNFPQFYFGGDYNPDQWPEEVWKEDARLMQEARVNLVSLGIFSWAKLEPADGIFDFGWMDRVFDLLHKHGVKVDLATPTACPPAWMIVKHPDILPVTAEGVILRQGSRRHYCPHSPSYHFYAKRIAQNLANRYKDHPALAMWHVDNEYSCHIGECFCENSLKAFRDWLSKKYGSIDRLNEAWGTTFWGQIYYDWQEIQAPQPTPATANPTQQLDWARFNSDSWIDCFLEQKEILKTVTPDIPVTTNFMCFQKSADYFKFASQEDVVANDSYPDPGQNDWNVTAAMACDLMRSIGKNVPWLLMEQATSQVNWRQRNSIKRPGVMRLGSMQAVARGANGILFFQWRQARFGSEKFHSAMVPHAGTETRTWREVTALGGELQKLKPLLKSMVNSQAAILMDWESWWALEIDSKPSTDLKLMDQIKDYYNYFYGHNILVDFVHPSFDLSKYKLVVIPSLYLLDEKSARNINDYVKNGGTALISFFSGISDQDDHVILGGYPGWFKEMLGISIEEFSPFQIGETNSILNREDQTFSCSFWADVIRCATAQELAKFEHDFISGNPAVTVNSFGSGKGYYLGTQLDKPGLEWLMNRVCDSAAIHPLIENLPEGIEVVCREDESTQWLFLLNHNDHIVEFKCEVFGIDLLTGIKINRTVTLASHGIEIIEINKS